MALEITEFAPSLQKGDFAYLRYATGPERVKVLGHREIPLRDGGHVKSIDVLSSVDNGYPRAVLEDSWNLLYPWTEDGLRACMDDAFEAFQRFKKHFGE